MRHIFNCRLGTLAMLVVFLGASRADHIIDQQFAPASTNGGISPSGFAPLRNRSRRLQRPLSSDDILTILGEGSIVVQHQATTGEPPNEQVGQRSWTTLI